MEFFLMDLGYKEVLKNKVKEAVIYNDKVHIIV